MLFMEVGTVFSAFIVQFFSNIVLWSFCVRDRNILKFLSSEMKKEIRLNKCLNQTRVIAYRILKILSCENITTSMHIRSSNPYFLQLLKNIFTPFTIMYYVCIFFADGVNGVKYTFLCSLSLYTFTSN